VLTFKGEKKLVIFSIFLVFTLILPLSHIIDLKGDNSVTNIDTIEGISLTANTWVANGNPICTVYLDQSDPQICSDGSGGAIITWKDYRGFDSSLYAQRIKADGTAQWTTDGVLICASIQHEWGPQICSDDSGGAIITWYDVYYLGDSNIYAQRINATGMVEWTTNGVAICTASEDQETPQICRDGSGGAIITWQDNRSGNWDIYAQRIDTTGMVQWTTNGVAICTASGNQINQQICSDGVGGAIITWQDYRGGNWKIYAQRINATGMVQWTSDGVEICDALVDFQEFPQICGDGYGGAIITWSDARNPITIDIYVQRINANGTLQWTLDGVYICASLCYQTGPQICSDGSGGAVITWTDDREGVYLDIYAQRANATGVVQWTVDGFAICTAIYDQASPQICSDSSGGAIITWQDKRNGNNFDIYKQWINATAGVQWIANGVATCTAGENQQYPQICSNGSSNGIITWQDARNGDWDIYAALEESLIEGTPIPFPFSLCITIIGFITIVFFINKLHCHSKIKAKIKIPLDSI
jgi:hypothetical protein